MERVILAWSGGKDAAMTLRRLHREGVDVVSLLTTISTAYDRSSMHGVRRGLYDQQAAALGIPLHVVELPAAPSNEAYEEAMADALAMYEDRAVEGVAFGDLFLEDVRSYREERLAGTPFEGRWPLWGADTTDLAADVIEAGFEATLVAVDDRFLDASFAGRPYDHELLAELPADVDPCGEHGEFHTFVHDGPSFTEPVAVSVGETVTRSIEGAAFHYADLRPA